MPETREQWLDDAPDPQETLAQVAAFLAEGVMKLSDWQLVQADHADRMRILLAAHFYSIMYHQAIHYHFEGTTPEVLILHKRFAELAAEHFEEVAGAGGLETLSVMAAQCHSS